MALNQGQIADMANVSRQTVSLAINDPKKLDPKTLERVLKVIKDSGYTPNQAARNFKKGRTGTLAMCFRIYSEQDFSNPFLFLTLKGLHQAAAQANYGIRFHPIVDIHDLDNLFLSRSVDGLLFMSYEPQKDREELLGLLDRDRPLVVFSLDSDLPSVEFDYDQGMDLAVKTLVNSGVTSPVYMSGGLDRYYNQGKYQGYQRALKANGLEEVTERTFHDTWTKDHGQEVVKKLINKNIPFDGIFSADGDLPGIGAIQELRQKGLAIPKDVKVLGGDGSIFCQTSDPEMTALVSPYEVRAQEGVQLLLQKLDTGSYGPNRRIPMTLRPGFSV